MIIDRRVIAKLRYFQLKHAWPRFPRRMSSGLALHCERRFPKLHL